MQRRTKRSSKEIKKEADGLCALLKALQDQEQQVKKVLGKTVIELAKARKEEAREAKKNRVVQCITPRENKRRVPRIVQEEQVNDDNNNRQ